MTDYALWSFVSIVFWLMLEAFFSGTETGMYSLNRFRLGTRAEGDPTGLCAADPLERFVLIPLASGKVEVWDPAGESCRAR